MDADEEFNNSLIYVDCPYCGERIWGQHDDIDSGLRKHLDYCERADEVIHGEEV